MGLAVAAAQDPIRGGLCSGERARGERVAHGGQPGSAAGLQRLCRDEGAGDGDGRVRRWAGARSRCVSSAKPAAPFECESVVLGPLAMARPPSSRAGPGRLFRCAVGRFGRQRAWAVSRSGCDDSSCRICGLGHSRTWIVVAGPRSAGAAQERNAQTIRLSGVTSMACTGGLAGST